MEHTNHENIRIIACPHVFSTENGRIDRKVSTGGTVGEHLRAIGWQPESMSARVYIDGVLIPEAQWEYAVPRVGQSLVARAIPTGTGGGKDVARIVAMLAVISLAMYVSGGGLGAILPEALGMAFASGTTAANVLAVATSIVGTLALNGLIPAPLPRRALPQPLPAPRLQEAA
jgi:hypothetical protein